LKKDGSGGVKNEAAAALANILGHINSINNARILPALADIFRREDSTWIKRRLIGAIANIGGEDAYKILQQISALEMDFYVREAAKEAAAKIKNI
jgi:predicted metal-dependent phosphoesterase TrpH